MAGMISAHSPTHRNVPLAIIPVKGAFRKAEAPVLITNTRTICPIRISISACKTTLSIFRQERSRTPFLESIRNSLITNRTAPAIIICWPRVLQSTKARASLLLRMISRTIPDLMARATTSAHTSGILKVFNFALQ